MCFIPSLTPARKLQVLLAVFLAISSSGCSEQVETKEVHLGRAKDYAAGAQKDPARADGEFNAALKLDPKSALAHLALANLYWSRNDLKAPEQGFKTAADLAPSASPLRMQYADFKLRTGALPEAKSNLENVNANPPDYLPASVGLMKTSCAERNNNEDCDARTQTVLAQDTMNYDGLLQDGIRNIEKGDAGKAVRELEYLSRIYTRDAPVRYQLARAYLLLSAKSTSLVEKRNAFESAENLLNDALKLDPTLNAATVLLAEIKIAKGSPAAAVDLLAPLVKERPQIAQAHYLLARAYLAQQKASDALAVYRQMTELFSQDPQPFFLAGSILLAQGQQQDARQAFEKSVEISPDYLPAVERLVDLDLATKQYASALEQVQKLIDKDPKQAQAWALRGKIYLAQRDFAHAEPDLLKAIDLNPKLEPAYQLLAQLYDASNRQEEAIAKLSAFVENNKGAPAAAPALLQLGMINERLKHYDAARDAYEKLLAIAPNFAPALNNLAILYVEQFKQLDKAYDLATKAKEVTNDPHIADTLAWILFKKGDYRNALRLLEESADKLPDNPTIQFHLGMAHYMLGEEEPARIALQKATEASADFPGKDEARQRLALLAMDAKAGNPAVRTELENYLRKQPDDPAALTRLGEVQQRDGAVDQAVKTYEKVVADDPLYAPAARQLALLYGQLSTDSAKAYDLVSKARQAYPDDPGIAKTLGILDYRRGYYPQAAELLKQAGAKRRDDPELLYYLGEVHRQLKEWDECKGVLQRALTLNLSPGLSEDAKRALADCSESAPG
jgi:tetratricopeptide (TPR) repeat protein